MTIATEEFQEDESMPAHDDRRVGGWIGMILLLLALGAGGFFSWKKWFAGPSESAPVNVGTIPDRFVRRAAAAPRPSAELAKDGVHPIGGNMFRVTSGEYYMTLAPVETTYAPLRLFVSRADVLPADARVLIRMARDPGLAAAASGIGMDADTVKKMAAFRTQLQGGMSIPKEDHDQLAAQWKTWNEAKDPAAKKAIEKTLLPLMKEVGARNLEATKKQYSDLTAEIKKLVTDQQLARYRQMRGL